MASHVKVRFIESGLVNKGNGFILRDCPSWEKIYQNTPYGTINIHGKKVPFEQSIIFHEQLGISLFFVCPSYVNLRIPLTPHKSHMFISHSCYASREGIASTVPLSGVPLGGFTMPDIFRAESITGCSLYTL